MIFYTSYLLYSAQYKLQAKNRGIQKEKSPSSCNYIDIDYTMDTI